MSKNQTKNPFIRIYSYVGTPELVFFIGLLALIILPVFSTNKYLLLSSVVDSFFLGSLYFLVNSIKPRFFKGIVVFIIIALINVWTNYLGYKLNNAFDNLSTLIVTFIAFSMVFRRILDHRKVDIDTVISAISGYILIGFTFGLVFYAVEVFDPGSFRGSGVFDFYKARYLSFVTISTLGFGDFVPITEASKVAVIVATLTGQFYMVIIMGVIVGKFINSSNQ